MADLLSVRPLFSLVMAAAYSASLAPAQVEFSKEKGDQIAIRINGQSFSTLFLSREYPKPFLHPLRTSTGEQVTRSYPTETVAGESNDHQHHRGLWIGYGEINGLNFWENEFHYTSNPPQNFDPAKRGLVVLRKIDRMANGGKSGEIRLTLDWIGPDKKPILEEKRTVTFHAGNKKLRTIDFDFTLTAKERADFADTKEGFFAIRLADSMTEKNGGLMTNSEGAQTEKNVWGKPANWVDYKGEVAGKKTGVAVFDHPGNYHHPERWHSRAYGLFAVNPWGLKDFEPKTPGKGGYSMATGDSLRFRYRVVIHPGDLTNKDIEQLYSTYIH